jgi:biotin-dependent carboxylase-like uncharacterized protein
VTSLVVVRARGPSAVQDMGRPGLMYQGIPPGGALVPELLARANTAAGNARGDAGLELFGGLTLEARGGPALVAFDDGGARLLAEGESVDVAAPAETRVRYLAVRGGIDAPVVLGSRSTLIVAGIGHWLRAGDVLPLGARVILTPSSARGKDPIRDSWGPSRAQDDSVAIIPGPDADRFPSDALSLFLASTWTISPASDRVGIRLDGPPVPRLDDDLGVSAPMVRGAIQLPAGGAPIVLGPDHPTTGGYPVLAVVASSDWGSLAARRAGENVQFRT